MNAAEAWAAGWQAGYEQARADVAVAVLEMKQSIAPAPPKHVAASPQPLSDGIDRLNDIDIVQVKLGGLGRTKVYRLIADGELKSVKIGKRRFVPDSAIAEYIQGLQ